MNTQDYYSVLDISKNATGDDIRKAYRKAARKFHPDINKDAGAEEKFKRIGEAYEVLKDPEKRKLYDQYGKNWKKGRSSHSQQGFDGFSHNRGAYGSNSHYEGGGFGEGDNLNDILKNLFGDAGGFQGGQGNAGWHHGTPEEYELQVSLEDIYFGAEKHISLQTWESDEHGGLKPVNKELKVTIPKGVTDGSVIRIGGGSSLNEKLNIRLTVVPHKRFTVQGYNLKTVVAVSPWEAMLGAKIPVETLDGKVNLTVVKGAQNGKQLRVKAKGLPRKNGTSGDLIVTLNVCLPSDLNEEEEKLLKSVAEKSEFDPRKIHGQRPISAMAGA